MTQIENGSPRPSPPEEEGSVRGMAASLQTPASASSVDDPRVIAAVQEYLAALEAGTKPNRHEFLARHATIADAVALCLDGLEFVHGAAAGLQSPAERSHIDPAVSSGTPLGDFRILRELGRGGMGVVYEAEQMSLGRRVALKVLPFAATLDAKQLQRFKNEAQAAAHLHHTNIVPVHAVACERGVHFYAMQFIEGQTLAALIGELRAERAAGGVEREAQSAEREASTVQARIDSTVRSALGAPRSTVFFRTVAHLGIQAAEALEHAHSLGVIHRDIKPANLLVETCPLPTAHCPLRLWITDFGLAQIQSDTRLTMSGDMLGTLRYMSPEQALAKQQPIDHRTDLYSLGATLYELLTLEPAVGGKDREEILRQIAFEEPRPPRRLNPTIPHDLETIVLKALAKEPAERYATAQALANDLRRFLEDKPIQARRPTLWQRLKRWARRHRSVVWAAGIATFVVLLLTVAGLAISNAAIDEALRKQIGATQEKDKALQAERELLERATKSLYYQLITSALRTVESEAGGPERYLARCPEELRGWEWHFVNRFARYRPPTLPGSANFAFHPNGKLLAVAIGKDLKVRDAVTGEELLTGQGHTAPVLGVAFRPDGKQFASTSRDHTVLLWELRQFPEKGALLASERTLIGHTDSVASPSYSPDGRYLATVSRDRTVRVWDTATGKERYCLPGIEGVPPGIAFSPDCRHLACASGERAVKIWDVATGREVLSLDGHGGKVISVHYTRDGRYLASMCIGDRMVRLWEVHTGRELFQVPDVAMNPGNLAFSADSRRLATGNMDGPIGIYDVPSGREMLTLPETVKAISLVFSPDGKRLAGTSAFQTKLWDTRTGDEAISLRGHGAKENNRVAFSPDGNRLVSASSDDRTIRIWDGTPLNEQLGPHLLHLDSTSIARSVAFSHDGRRVATGHQDRTIKVWDITAAWGTKVTTPLSTFRGHENSVKGVAFSPDGRWMASAGLDGRVRLWDAKTGRDHEDLTKPLGSASTVRFSPDSRLVAAATDLKIVIWEIATRQLRSLPCSSTVNGLAFSPDGQLLAAALRSGTVQLWDVTAWQDLPSLKGHSNRVFDVAFSPDGKRLASASWDPTVKIWDLKSREVLNTIEGFQNYAYYVDFSSDGRYLATASGPELKLWDATSFKEVYRGENRGWINGIAFSPDGGRLIASHGLGGVFVYDLKGLGILTAPAPPHNR